MIGDFLQDQSDVQYNPLLMELVDFISGFMHLYIYEIAFYSRLTRLQEYLWPSRGSSACIKVCKQQLFDGKTVENKGKLILTEIFLSVQKHDI